MMQFTDLRNIVCTAIVWCFRIVRLGQFMDCGCLVYVCHESHIVSVASVSVSASSSSHMLLIYSVKWSGMLRVACRELHRLRCIFSGPTSASVSAREEAKCIQLHRFHFWDIPRFCCGLPWVTFSHSSVSSSLSHRLRMAEIKLLPPQRPLM